MSQLPPVLIVPGRGNSEPAHWQSILEASIPGAIRVDQQWEINDIEEWSANIDQAVSRLDAPPLIIAHSFGCLATAYAHIALGTSIGAVLFVAPASPSRFGIDRGRLAQPINVPGLLIASENDPWLSLDGAVSLAADWEIPYLNLGAVGHINVASGHGYWPLGEQLAHTMRAQLAIGATHPTIRLAPFAPNSAAGSRKAIPA